MTPYQSRTLDGHLPRLFVPITGSHRVDSDQKKQFNCIMATGIKKRLTPLFPWAWDERDHGEPGPYGCWPLMFPYGVVVPVVYIAHEHDMPRTTKNLFRSVDIHFRDIIPATVSHFIAHCNTVSWSWRRQS